MFSVYNNNNKGFHRGIQYVQTFVLNQLLYCVNGNKITTKFRTDPQTISREQNALMREFQTIYAIKIFSGRFKSITHVTVKKPTVLKEL